MAVFRLRKPGGGSALRGGDTLRAVENVPFSASGSSTSSGSVTFAIPGVYAASGSSTSSGTVVFKRIRVSSFAGGSVSSGSVVFEAFYTYITPLEVPSPMSATVRQATPSTPDSEQNQLIRVNGSGGALVYGFLDLDIPPEIGSGATVLKAHVLLYKSAAWPSGTQTVTLTPITGDWDPLTITYDDMPTLGSGTDYTVAGSGAAGDLIELDVTDDIRDAVATRDTGANTFHGFRISTTSIDDLLLYSAHSTRFEPFLRIEASRRPNPTEDGLPSGGRAVSKTKPVFPSRFSDLDAEDTIAGIHIRVSTEEDFDTVTEYDSGEVTANSATFDFANPPAGAPATPDLPTATTLYWDNRVKDNHGLWSDWSPTWEFQVIPKGTLTLVSPSTATIASPTPTIEVSFTPDGSEVAVEREIEIEKFEDGLWRTHKLVKRHISSSLEYTVTDADALSEGIDYRLSWRLWDDVDREDMAGDRSFLEVVHEFSVETVSV